MNAVHVTAHAIERYQERVANVPADIAEQALRSPTILKAVEIGATAVILPGGCKVILAGYCVITVKPKSCRKRNAVRRQRERDEC